MGRRIIKKLFFDLIFVGCLVLVVFSLCKLWKYYCSNRDGKEEYSRLKTYVKEEKDDGEKNQEEKAQAKEACPVTVDFNELRKINEDITGWIYIPDTEINYPIVRGRDNEYYLRHTFEKKENHMGAIFMDIQCQDNFTSDNTILYGHNMKNGSMFGLLKKIYDTNYNAQADYEMHTAIWIITPRESRKYRLFCAREINIKEDVETYSVEFDSKEAYKDYLKKEWESSLYQIEPCPEGNPAMITLSTCTSDSKEGRFIVQAVLEKCQ